MRCEYFKEFSKDPDAFNMLAIQQIGVPPMAGYVAPPSSSATAPNPAAALQFLLSSQGLAAASLAVAAALPSTSPSITVSLLSSTLASLNFSFFFSEKSILSLPA